jgi:nucleolar protein 12
VDEILAMGESTLKFAKRKLRVQRCKTVPGMSVNHSAPQDRLSATKTRSLGRSARPKEAGVIPMGDPSLGEKLLGLSKEERKQRKSTDPGRVARRLAKKKLRMAMASKMGSTAGKALKKERHRVRPKVKKA